MKTIIIIIMLVMAAFAWGDSDWDDSPDFTLNLLSPFAKGTWGQSDSGNFPLNLLSVNRSWADSDNFSYEWSAFTNPFAGIQPVCTWPLDASKLLEMDDLGNWHPITQTPPVGSTIIVINHGWNDGPEGNGNTADDDLKDLARLIKTEKSTAYIYIWHWGDGENVKSDANPNGKNGLADFIAVLKYIQANPNSKASKIIGQFVGNQYCHDEINIAWNNAKKHGTNLGNVMMELTPSLTPDNYNIHMIGHSFGGVVSAEAAKVINTKQPGKIVKQLTTIETPALPWPLPDAIKAVNPTLASRVEVLYYDWVPDILGVGFGGPAQSGDNLLNLQLMRSHYRPNPLAGKLLHGLAIKWYIDSIDSMAACTPNTYGFNWSFASTYVTPSWPAGLPTGLMEENWDNRGCVQTHVYKRIEEGFAKTAKQVQDDFDSAASWVGNNAQIVGERINGTFNAMLSIDSAPIIAALPAEEYEDIYAAGSQITTSGVYKQISVPIDALNLELDMRFTNVVEGHFLAVTINGKNVLLIDPYVEGVSDTFKTYSAAISEYAGQSVTLQIALEGALQEQTVVLIDALRLTQITLGADVNEDGRVDVLDVIALSEYWAGPVFAKGDASDKADVNRDGKINMDDFAMLAENWLWQKSGYIPGDLDHSGQVDMGDLAIVSSYWMSTCDAQTRCGGSDSEPDGDVDSNDLVFLGLHWLDNAQ